MRSQSQRTTSLRDLARQTFADLDLDAGVALGHILDASHYLRHLGGCVRGRWERYGGFGLVAWRPMRLSLREMVMIVLREDRERERERGSVALNTPSQWVISSPSPVSPRNGMLVRMTSRMAATSKVRVRAMQVVEGASFWSRGWGRGEASPLE